MSTYIQISFHNRTSLADVQRRRRIEAKFLGVSFSIRCFDFLAVEVQGCLVCGHLNADFGESTDRIWHNKAGNYLGGRRFGYIRVK